MAGPLRGPLILRQRFESFLGNLNPKEMALPDYPEAIIIETNGEPVLITSKALPIVWTEAGRFG